MNPYNNPYNNSILSTEEFLRTSYLLLKRKVTRLKEIESSKKRNKLPLPILKEKLSITTAVLEAIRLLQDSIDYNSKYGPALADVFNDISIMISKANIGEPRYYNVVIQVIDEFLEDSQELS